MFPIHTIRIVACTTSIKTKFILLAGSEGTRWTWRCVAAEEFKEIENHYSVLAKLLLF